jgi:hypothetical protein
VLAYEEKDEREITAEPMMRRQVTNDTTVERNPLDLPDLPLLEGENQDLRQEARDVIGEWWLKTPNVRLGGRTPDDVISAHRGAWVRDIVRSIKHIGIS